MLLMRPNVENLIARRNVPGLIKALRYKNDVDIQIAAARALALLNDSKALLPLQHAAKSDPTPLVRREARAAIKHLQAKELLTTDIAIVGGGIAGCYAAWRLTDQPAEHRSKVTVFEDRENLGGRIRSLPIPGLPCSAELGPMRFSTAQRRIVGLLDRLEVSCKPHFAKPPFAYPTSFFLRACTISPTDPNSKTSWVKVYTGLSSLSQTSEFEPANTLSRLCADSESKKDFPDVLVAYAIVTCLHDVYFRDDDDFKQHNPDQAVYIRDSLQSLTATNPQWSKLTKAIGVNGWDLIKQYGWIHLNVGEGEEEDVKLSQTGFWNLLQHYLGNEAFLLVHDATGYESVFGNWNAAEAIKWYVDDFQTQDYLMPMPGFKAVIDLLESKARHRGCEIKPNYRLKRIHTLTDSDLGWELEFEIVRGSDKGRKVFARARQVILALPQDALKRLKLQQRQKQLLEPAYYGQKEQISQGRRLGRWQELKEYHFSGVRRQKLLKIFLLYSHPWWFDGNFHGQQIEGMRKLFEGDTGRVFTDLPIRQVYYFGPDWMNSHKLAREKGQDDPKYLSEWCMIMASYSDAHYVDFWRPFAKLVANEEERFRDDPEAWNQLGDQQREELEKLLAGSYGMPSRMVHKVRRQLAELHSIRPEDCPKPLLGVYMDWGQQPRLKAGWHTWEINQQINPETWQIYANLIQPFPNLYICGEAFSHYQGWIEGALETANEVLSVGFGLPEPTWMKPSADTQNPLLQ